MVLRIESVLAECKAKILLSFSSLNGISWTHICTFELQNKNDGTHLLVYFILSSETVGAITED